MNGEVEWLGKEWSVPDLERQAEVCDDPYIAHLIRAELKKIR
ncbi:hypothetical protein [uncultured Mediterranean phage uvDeep-CGR2-AD3-C191]|nr:hypothetical protein [uncultured Mediterranean phage uvDeep-CGR2-AD3-C191]